MPEPSNRTRAGRGMIAVTARAAYIREDVDDLSHIQDTITDILHYAASTRLNTASPARVLRIAMIQYANETTKEAGVAAIKVAAGHLA